MNLHHTFGCVERREIDRQTGREAERQRETEVEREKKGGRGARGVLPGAGVRTRARRPTG